VSVRWDGYPSLRLGRGTHIDFRARIQREVIGSQAPLGEDDPSELDLTRRRVGVEGEIGGIVGFQVERELGVEIDAWRDVYADYRQFDAVRVQAGKFKLPFSLDANTSSANLDFVYRSRAASELAPGRDRGGMVHGRVFSRAVQYEIGLFDHDGRNARPRDTDRVFGGRTVAARARAAPFPSPLLEDLTLGMAMTRSEVPEGYPALRGRTALDARFFSPRLWVKGARQRVGLEVRWRPGPFSVTAEHIRLTDERHDQSVEDSDLSPFLATGWYISGTWALTGERKARGVSPPSRPLFRGGIGSVELAVRTERLSFGSVADDGAPSTSPRADVVLGNGERVETFGVNWYPIRWIKVQMNLIRETIADPEQGPLPARSTFWSRAARFQFTL
jgi:phosphate-selective porin